MKILHVSNFFSPAYGGSAEVPYQLSRELAGRGHQVTVYTSDLGIGRDLPVPGVNVHTFRTYANWANFLVTPGIILKTREKIKDLDIIHMHNYRTFQNLAVHHYAKKRHVPYVLQAHGSLPRIVSRKRLKRLFDRVWGYTLLQDAAKVIAVTEFEAAQYKNMGVREEKIEIIPHGVNLAEFASLPQIGAFRQRYGLDSSQSVVLYLGRIHKIKGLDLLIQAFAGVAGLLPDVKLVIAGPDNGYLGALRKSVSGLRLLDRVLFTGPLYGQAKLEAYVDCDVYVLPSTYEIFGITILEAWACSKPVVTTDRCGLADIVDNQAGLVVPPDMERLRDALADILQDAKLKQRFGEKGRVLVHERFNWGKMGEQVEKLYQRILKT